MRFIPVNKHLYIEEIREEPENSNFQWQKNNQDLVAVKILSTNAINQSWEGKTAIVISTMIQEFKFGKESFRVIPDSGVIGFIEE